MVMSVLTRTELRSLLTLTSQENEELRKDNEKLILQLADALSRIKIADDRALELQLKFNWLLELIRTRYDLEFDVEDIPEYLKQVI